MKNYLKLLKIKKMRQLLLALFVSSFCFSQDITVVHFNYQWNQSNAVKYLDKLKNVKVQYANVEEQSDLIRKSIKSVPTIIIYKNGQPAYRFEAGLKMRIEETIDDIQEAINSLKIQ
tara:strand:+ start:17 stop:367 length:351 start_codon:yes stop_codon:yes gene_type:complete